MQRAARLLPSVDRNGRIVLTARALRSFAFGLNSVALGLYLSAAGLDSGQIGLVLSAALAGTLLLTLVIAGWGDRIGRRRLLIGGSALMITASLIPLAGAQPLLLAVLALSGMVAVNANESAGLQSVDQALLPQTVPSDQRTAAFAAYNLLASAGAAVGALAVGILPGLGAALGLSGADIYTPAFMAYAVTGICCLALHARLDRGAETDVRPSRGLTIHRSRSTVARLSLLFSVDSLASSFAVHSFLAYFLAVRFGATPAELGAIFFAGSVLTAVSFPVAAWLSRRIGLINTMVFTHIPSSLFLVGVALAPNLAVAAAFQIARSALSSMDVPARQSYVMAVVEPSERTATAGFTSLARAAAQVPGPAIAGVLLVPFGLGVPLLATAVLKIVYDLGLFGLFRARPAPEERPLAGQERL